ncbi:hypothetical protein RclHR1_15740003 [Rhizophagus clarus]|uniref:F-box domain-containing protein n=1 Tax=Rhizophagus clarus TaxID=94130 RepID=A0A2Z6QG04_9GLOM|nr:hypothetical protein RclHR1_15740003 [Rhizophagus clarus]GES72781.1 hypothetical protein GLOIN_2v1881853 [Rhizophagus clarus]
MTYSKTFLGDLPELTYEIIKYFKNDFSTLHSCILVNRLWCRLAIPLLWENPFSISTENYNFIEIYLHNLNDDLKSKLNEYRANDNLLPSNTLFYYPSFIKYLNTLKIITSVGKWVEDTIRTLKPENRYYLQNLDTISASNFKRLIYMSLLKMFIENETNLHTFDIEVYAFLNCKFYYNDIFELILRNPKFIHNVRNLKLYIGSSSGFSIHNNSSEYTLIKYHISQMINLHHNLKKIVLSYNSFPLYQSFLLSKDYNCSNTLNTIMLYQVNFKSIINLDKVFEQLNVLESVHIVYCSYLNTSFIQQIINITKPFKLKSLFINWRSQIDGSLQLLLQKSGDYLENFGYRLFESSVKHQSFELIIKYCKNIKFLDLSGIIDSQISHLMFNLIENIKQNLNFLSISAYRISNISIESSSIILQNLGQILPSKLEYLNLILHIKISDYEIFLKNSQNTFIKKLLINNRMLEYSDDIAPYTKKYIMKEKRIKYLAIRDIKNKELFYLEDEVNEFKLYNIKVQRYIDLFIGNYGFIRKLD